MRRYFSTLLISGLLAAGPALAIQFRQPSAQRANAARASRYDVRREVRVEGSVEDVIMEPGPGASLGGHVLLTTSSGKIDAHLGDYALRGPNALSLTPGQRVKMVGVMTTVGGRHLFLVRSLQAGLRVYRIRSEHGFLLRTAPADWKAMRSTAPGGRP